MAKKFCVVCNKALGMMAGKVEISDGYVCSDCLLGARISILPNRMSYNKTTINELIKSRMPFVNSFTPTKNINNYLQIDENQRTFMVGNQLFFYTNLLSFELQEDGETITKGGLGRAVAGGLLFGGVGAVVGGVTGGKKSKGICTSMRLKITLKNAHTDTAYINFLAAETKTNGIVYQAAQGAAQSCLSALQIIADLNESEQMRAMGNQNQSVSAADEIMKFKQLLDTGVITTEEFEAKKKQLLGL